METILITIITFRTDQQTHIIHDIKCNIISIISVTSTYGNISSFNGTKAEEVYYQFKYLWNAYYPTPTNNIITYISYTNNMMTYKYWNLKIFQWNNKHMETILITIITFRTDQQTHAYYS
eukprot:706872_1